jgi:hypothetical protein
MALIERLMGVDEGVHGSKVPVHAFAALLREVARTRITGGVAVTELNGLLPAADPLRPADTSEAQLLLTSITGAGNATAQLNRAGVIDDGLLLAEHRAPGWDTPAKVRTKLGLPQP